MRALAAFFAWLSLTAFDALDALRDREAAVPAEDAILAATLSLPETGTPPYPAVVIIPGSGPVDRRSVYRFRDAALAAGLAAVIYDKRGVGGSSGLYERFSLEGSETMLARLGADAAAMFEWLTAQPGIDPERTGYLGVSQGGWVAPAAATRTGAAFIAIACGTPFSAGEEIYHSRLTGEGRTPLSQGAQRMADRRLRRYDGPEGFDPHPYWEELTAPTLWMFGAEDLVIPSRASYREVRRRYRGHARRLVPGMTHCWREADTGRPMTGLAGLLSSWLHEEGLIDEG